MAEAPSSSGDGAASVVLARTLSSRIWPALEEAFHELLQEVLDVRTLDRSTRQLVLFGMLLLLVCLPLALGVRGPATDVQTHDGVVTIGLVSLFTTLLLLGFGWGYVLTAALGASAQVRRTVLAAHAPGLAVLFGVLGHARSNNTVDVAVVVGPFLISGALLWWLAEIRGIRRPLTIPRLTTVTVIVVVPVLLYIALNALWPYLGELGKEALPPAAVAVDYFDLSLIALLPLYSMIGVYTAEVLTQGAGWLVGIPARLLPQHAGRAQLIAGMVVAVAALGVDFGSTLSDVSGADKVPAQFRSGPALVISTLAVWSDRDLRNLLPTLIWTLATTALIIWIRSRRASIQLDLSFAVALGALLMYWALWLLLWWLPQITGWFEPVDEHVLFGLIGAAGVVAVGYRLLAVRRVPAKQVIVLGVAGVWILCLAWPSDVLQLRLPDGAPSVPVRSFDELGTPDPLVLSSIGLFLITLIAWRKQHLRPLAVIAAAWTLTLVFTRGYLEWVSGSGEALPEVFAAGEALLFVILVAVTLPGKPYRLRFTASALALIALATSGALTLWGPSSDKFWGPYMIVLATAAFWELGRSGARVTNVQGRHWPRDTRVLSYLGSVLIGLAIALFFATAEGSKFELYRASIAQVQGAELLFFGVPAALLRALGNPGTLTAATPHAAG